MRMVMLIESGKMGHDVPDSWMLVSIDLLKDTQLLFPRSNSADHVFGVAIRVGHHPSPRFKDDVPLVVIENDKWYNLLIAWAIDAHLSA